MKSQKVITAGMFRRAFCSEWSARVAAAAGEIHAAYGESTSWTKLMKGEDGVLASVMRALATETGVPLELETERYTVDALYLESDPSDSDAAYPSRIHALIEHENSYDVEVEMWKLVFWRAPLKVIIFYDWIETDKLHHRTQQPLPNRVDWLQNKIDYLFNIYERANTFHPENEATEYLLIVGNRDEGEQIRWRWASPSQREPLEFG